MIILQGADLLPGNTSVYPLKIVCDPAIVGWLMPAPACAPQHVAEHSLQHRSRVHYLEGRSSRVPKASWTTVNCVCVTGAFFYQEIFEILAVFQLFEFPIISFADKGVLTIF